MVPQKLKIESEITTLFHLRWIVRLLRFFNEQSQFQLVRYLAGDILKANTCTYKKNYLCYRTNRLWHNSPGARYKLSDSSKGKFHFYRWASQLCFFKHKKNYKNYCNNIIIFVLSVVFYNVSSHKLEKHLSCTIRGALFTWREE